MKDLYRWLEAAVRNHNRFPQLKSLYSSPILLIPAPGENKLIIVQRWRFTFVTRAYSSAFSKMVFILKMI
jgi:hypothetical protein